VFLETFCDLARLLKEYREEMDLARQASKIKIKGGNLFMKRFLSLFAILAMIVSMFSGVAFALTPTSEYEVQLTTGEVMYYGGATKLYTINGRVAKVSGETVSYSGQEVTIEDADGTVDSTTRTVSGSTFSNLQAIGLPIGNYKVAVEPVTTSGIYKIEPADFVVVPRLDLESPASLNFNYPVTNEVYITGVFVDGNGPKSADGHDLVIGYADDDIIAEANYVNENSFGFLFNGTEFTKPGKVALYYYNGTEMVKTDITGEVKASDLSFSITPSRLANGLDLDGQKVTVTTNLGSSFFTDGQLKSGYEFGFVLKDGTSNATPAAITFDEVPANTYTRTNQKFDIEVDVDGLTAGNYKLEATLYKDDVAAYKSSVDLRVDKPQRYTLIGWSDSNLTTNKITFGFDGAEAQRDIKVVYHDGSVATAITDITGYYYKVTYSGAGLSEKTISTKADDADMTFDFTPAETGVVKMLIEAFNASDSRVASYTRELEVKGMNVVLSDSEIVVDTEYDFIVTVTNEEGVPVNNAEVTIGEKTVWSGSANIIDGNYRFKDLKATEVANMTVEVVHSSDDYETVTKTLKVVGKDVYTVDAETSTLLNGIQENVYVSVHDEDGDAVYADFEVLEYDSKGNLIKDEAVFTVSGSRFDRNNDGIRESNRISITPNKSAVELVIRATSANAKEKGDVTIEVVKPEVVHTGASVVTENFETSIEFTVVDPRDGSVMEDLTLTLADSIAFDLPEDPEKENLEDMTIEALRVDIEDVWTAEVKIQDVEWDLEDDDVNEINIMMGAVKLGSLEVKKAVVEATPETIIIGAPTRLVMTYSDAEGNPIYNKAVTLDGTEIGKTDEDGKVEYSASSTSSVSLTFKFATDVKDVTVSKSVRSSADVEAPVATIEVDGNSAVIRITDNVRVSKALVNGEEVDMFFPMAEITHIVSLRPGVNTFTVQAVDINNNYSVTTLTAEPAVDEVVSFTIGEASEYGVPVLMGETTMVPVRFAEILGAVIDWDNDTKTATYSANGTVVEVTVGSTTAVVNGENVQMPVAPYINEVNRTMVPLRMIAQELGFTVTWTSHDAPITITK
jgi:hypothetical protein